MPNKIKAILIHQLPEADINDALSYFSSESVEKVSHGSEGLKIFFKEYNLVRKNILRENIKVNELFYKIYPMVTNLTIFKIGPHVTNAEIKNIMQDYGNIIDSYRIQDTVENDFCKTVSLTDHSRVILDVPEIFANFNLLPVRLPGLTDRTFEVDFFCRLCRCNGHMQFQCPNVRKSSSYVNNQVVDFIRRPSFEDNFSDSSFSLNRTNSPRSNFCDDLQNSEICLNTSMKSDKEQKYSSSQPCHSKNEFYYKNSPNKLQSKNYYSTCEVVENKDVWKKIEYKNLSTTKKSSFETLHRRKSIEKKCSIQKCGNNETKKEIQTCNVNKCSYKRKQPKKSFKFHLSRLLPPNIDVLETMELLKNASESDFYDISAELKSVLMRTLVYNHKRNKKNRILNFIGMILKKNELKNCQREKTSVSSTSHHTKEPDNIEDKKSNSKIIKENASPKRKITLSSGIREAIFLTTGELQPEFLCNFLNQIRGRKKLLEIASIFTKNFSALASQLMEVQNMYYKHVKRGKEEDRDIHYIKRLRQKLLNLSGNTTNTSIKNELDVTEASVKTELLVKEEYDMAEIPIKRETDVTEAPVKEEANIFM